MPTATATPIPFTPLGPQEVKEIIKRIGGFPAKGGKLITPEGATIVNSVDELFHVFETGHYLLTGEPSGWIPKVLSSEEWRDVVRETGNVEMLDWLAWCCEQSDAGLVLVMNGDVKAVSVLVSIAHEAGHARARTLNPDQKDPPGTDWRTSNFGAIWEAQAFALSAALIRKLGEYAGINAKYLPTRYALTDWVDRFVDDTTEKLDDRTESHARGRALMWGAVLSDPELADLKRELSDRGILSGDSLFRLHDHFVRIEADEVDAYVLKYVETFDIEGRLIRATILRRDASIDDEGFFKHGFEVFLYP